MLYKYQLASKLELYMSAPENNHWKKIAKAGVMQKTATLIKQCATGRSTLQLLQHDVKANCLSLFFHYPKTSHKGQYKDQTPHQDLLKTRDPNLHQAGSEHHLSTLFPPHTGHHTLPPIVCNLTADNSCLPCCN